MQAPSATHSSTIVTGPNPPKDARALRARALLARLIEEAGPVPAGYKPDETVTEDGSNIPPEMAYQRQQNIPQHHHVSQRRRKDDPEREREAQEFLERQRRPSRRRTTERRRGDADEEEEQEYSPRRPPPAKQRGNYYEPHWARPPAGKYQLNVYRKKVLDHRIDLSAKSLYIVGRMTDCDIQVQNNSISRYHAVFQHSADGVYIYDLGSSNGTFLNDHGKLVNDGIVPKRKYKRILSSDIIMFGEHDMFYVLEGGQTRADFNVANQQTQRPSRFDAEHNQLAQAGFQFDPNKDPRARERDYRGVVATSGHGVRRDIKSARDHFRARFEDMQR